MTRRSDFRETIIRAIRESRVLYVDYYDPRGERRVEPHACGISERGNDVVRVFQVSGPSRSGQGADVWRMMRLDRICGIALCDDTFEPRLVEGYSRDDDNMTYIYAQL